MAGCDATVRTRTVYANAANTLESAADYRNMEQVFVARQPILDRQKRVFGYELLFGGATGDTAEAVPVDEASATVITEAVLAFGLDTLTQGRPTFVKVTRPVLLGGLPAAMTPDQFVVELPDDIDAAPAVRDACEDLRRKGYRIALDHFVPGEAVAPLLRYADYLKTDLGSLDAVMHQSLGDVRPVRPPTIIAQGLDTAEDFAVAAAMGCTTFQGGFIGQPTLKSTADIPANRVAYLRLLHALQNPNLSMHALEDLIKPDASMVYRVLRAVNSAAFAQHSRIDSLRQALVLLGCATVRQWASLWTMGGFSGGAPDELVSMSVIRGRCCELIANDSWSGAFDDGFLLGACSLFDAILDVPMTTVLQHLPLPEQTDAALRGADNHSRRLLDAVIAYERGQWETFFTLSAEADIDARVVPAAYQQAITWFDAMQQATSRAA